jgi:hypothetical protein
MLHSRDRNAVDITHKRESVCVCVCVECVWRECTLHPRPVQALTHHRHTNGVSHSPLLPLRLRQDSPWELMGDAVGEAVGACSCTALGHWGRWMDECQLTAVPSLLCNMCVRQRETKGEREIRECVERRHPNGSRCFLTLPSAGERSLVGTVESNLQWS